MVGVEALFSTVTACDWPRSTLLRKGCSVDAEAAVSWPVAGSSCASWHPSVVSFAGRAADLTTLAGAKAKTYTLAVFPTSEAGYWIVATALAVVAVTVAVTAMLKGGARAAVALIDPGMRTVTPLSLIWVKRSVPAAPSQVPV